MTLAPRETGGCRDLSHKEQEKVCFRCHQSGFSCIKDTQARRLARMHTISNSVRIHAHLLPAGAFLALDTLLHPDASAHTKGPTYGHHTLHHTHAHPL